MIASTEVGSRICPPFLDLPAVLFDFRSTFLETSKLTFLMTNLLASTGWVGARVIKQILLEWFRTKMSWRFFLSLSSWYRLL